MLAEERRQRIAFLLKNEKRVSVSELSKAYGVSEETIRRDLEKLEMDGLARRTYGGALINEDGHNETPYDIRKRSDVEAKHTKDCIAKWTYEDVPNIMWAIAPLSKMWGIGPRMEQRLNKLQE